MDEGVLMALQYNITPIILFEYYSGNKRPLGDYQQWHAIGEAFAERFRPGSQWLESKGIHDQGVSIYTAVNEPMWKSNNPTPIPVQEYVEALSGLADGVHKADPELKVAPGGFQEVPLFAGTNPYIKGLVPLYNEGKLAAVDIHRYWDVKYVPMFDRYDFSLQSQFDNVKQKLGITADIGFWTTDFNFKKRLVDENEAARGFLTAIWDALGVVGGTGQGVTEFAMPWNIFNLTDKDESYGMTLNSDPWTPTARGKVLLMVSKLTGGMSFVKQDPKQSGEYILEGGDKKLWVWQNRKGWSSLYGTSCELSGIPGKAVAVEIYGWSGLYRSIKLSSEKTVRIDQLPVDETLMFLAK